MTPQNPMKVKKPYALDLCPRIAAVAEPAGITTIWGLVQSFAINRWQKT